MKNKVGFKQLFWLLIVFAFVSKAQAQEKKAYTLFDSKGKSVSYEKMLKTLSDYDVIFIGETHNCPIAHWMEYEIVKELYDQNNGQLVLGAEMFERDNQLLVDEYVSGLISSDRFETEAKLWDNYYTDYAPVLSFAREKRLPFVATNVPRRYANIVKNHGLDTLMTLSDDAKKLIAPLPIQYEDSEDSNAMFGMMAAIAGKKMANSSPSFIAQAQAIKDATMGWAIAQNFKNKFVHINGNFHSDYKGGIIPYLEIYRPGLKVVTICSIRQDEINSLDEENLGRADFVICVPTDMSMSY